MVAIVVDDERRLELQAAHYEWTAQLPDLTLVPIIEGSPDTPGVTISRGTTYEVHVLPDGKELSPSTGILGRHGRG
jgi:hypothetical protein